MGGGSSKGEQKQAHIACTARQSIGTNYAGPTLLSADVGGTSSRLHLFLPPPESRPMESDSVVPPERRIYEAKYENKKFESFTEICKTFLQDSQMERPPMLACLAVAGVVVDDVCTFVNLGWTLEAAALSKELGIQHVCLINDFVAQGYGILTLDDDTEVDVIQKARKLEGAPMAVLGAGTGLGEAFLTTGAYGDYEVWPTEGGHAEYAPRQDGSSKLEFELVQYLQIKYSAKARVSVERVVAGRGISNIYEFLAWKFPEKVKKALHNEFIGPMDGPRLFDPSVITRAAVNDECQLCEQAVNMWCSAYGAEAGVVALTYMPFGGLYLTGGVTHKLREFIMGKKGGDSIFLEAFLDKGRVTTMLMRVPVLLVKGEDMGQRGAMLKASRLYLERVRARRTSVDKGVASHMSSPLSVSPSPPVT